MNQQVWPERDRTWVARYRTAIVGRHVPAAVLERHEDELLEAVRAAGLPAAEVFGDAVELAGEDAADLATTDEAVRTSEGGLRAALREVGGALTGIGAVAGVLLFLRDGWYVDVELATLVAVSLAAVFVGWVVGRSLFSAGRPGWMTGVLLGVLAVAVVVIGAAVRVGPDVVAVADAPVLLLSVGLLGVVLLLVGLSRPVIAWRRRPWAQQA